MTEFFDDGIAGSTAYIRPMEGAYLTGAALYRAMADMLDGGREVQMMHIMNCKGNDWRKADVVHPVYRYRFKPVEKRTVTINGKVLVAPEVEAPKFGTHYWLVHAGFETAAQETWDAHRVDLSRLQTGHVFLTREDAQAMSDWLAKCRLGQT